MKINCDVVKDLLPQYADGTLEKDTEKLVKEHLDECEECRSYLDEITKINEELDRGEVPVAPSMGEIGALTKIKKRLRQRRLVTVLITIAAVFVVLLGAYIYGNMHYTYIPFEDSGIVVSNNAIRTSASCAKMVGIEDVIDDENVLFIFLLSNPISQLSDSKGEITTEGTYSIIPESDLENEYISYYIPDKVYYLPESAISKLPFIIHNGYMVYDLLDPNFWEKKEENMGQCVLLWSREE